VAFSSDEEPSAELLDDLKLLLLLEASSESWSVRVESPNEDLELAGELDDSLLEPCMPSELLGSPKLLGPSVVLDRSCDDLDELFWPSLFACRSFAIHPPARVGRTHVL